MMNGSIVDLRNTRMGKQSAKKIWEEEKAKKGVVGSNQNMLQNET